MDGSDILVTVTGIGYAIYSIVGVIEGRGNREILGTLKYLRRILSTEVLSRFFVLSIIFPLSTLSTLLFRSHLSNTGEPSLRTFVRFEILSRYSSVATVGSIHAATNAIAVKTCLTCLHLTFFCAHRSGEFLFPLLCITVAIGTRCAMVVVFPFFFQLSLSCIVTS